MKKIIISLFALIIAFTFTWTVEPASAESVIDKDSYTHEAIDKTEMEGEILIGEQVPVNKKVQALIDYYRIKDGSKYKGSGECYGYAEMMRKRFGSGSRTVTVNKKASGYNFYKYLKDVRPGTHVRFAYTYGGGNHSWCVFKVTKDKIYYADANIGYQNDIAYYVMDYDRHNKSNDAMKLQWYREPTGSYQVRSTVPRACVYDKENKIEVVWQPIKSAKTYTVYRSYSKNGKYTKIGTSKSPRFIDKNAKYGTVYYKVKGAGRMSSPGKVYHRLRTPDVTVSHDSAGYPVLSWDAVKGASKYVLYERVYPASGGVKLKKVKSTTKTKMTFKGNPDSYYTYYTLKALHKSNSKLNSYGTLLCGLQRNAPGAVIDDIVMDEDNFHINVSIRTPKINKDGDFLYMFLLRAESKDGEYTSTSNYGSTIFNVQEGGKDEYTSETVYELHDWLTNLPDQTPGKTYYYKVRLKNANGFGKFSKVYKFTVPEIPEE